jgi:hypothetical protein
MNHKRLAIILGICFVILVGFTLTSLLWPSVLGIQSGVPALTTGHSANKPEIALGKPCDDKEGSNFYDNDTHGLQCYFYGPSDNRKAIWIQPEFRLPHPSVALNKHLEWKNYTDRSLGITIPLLTIMEANEVGDKDIPVINFDYSSDTFLTIERVAKNGVSFENRMDQSQGNGLVMLDETTTLGNSQQARHMIIYGRINLNDPVEIWGIDKGDYYLYINAQMTDDSVMRYAIEYMVANLVVNPSN